MPCRISACLILTLLALKMAVAVENPHAPPSPFPSSSPSASATAAKPTTPTLIAPPRRDVPGRRHELTLGTLYIPSFYRPAANRGTDVAVFFHGAAWCAEQNFYDARRNAVLVSIRRMDYGDVFRDAAALRGVLDETTTTLAREGICGGPVRRLALVSFSGGYTGVREILKHSEFQLRVSDVVLADSLYGPRLADDPTRLNPEALAPFLAFARRAAVGEVTFLFSHLYPPEQKHRGNTTTVAARNLIEALGASPRPASGANSRAAQLLYRADQGRFHVLGYSGMTTQDHFEHFYALCDLLRESSLEPAQ